MWAVRCPARWPEHRCPARHAGTTEPRSVRASRSPVRGEQAHQVGIAQWPGQFPLGGPTESLGEPWQQTADRPSHRADLCMRDSNRQGHRTACQDLHNLRSVSTTLGTRRAPCPQTDSDIYAWHQRRRTEAYMSTPVLPLWCMASLPGATADRTPEADAAGSNPAGGTDHRHTGRGAVPVRTAHLPGTAGTRPGAVRRWPVVEPVSSRVRSQGSSRYAAIGRRRSRRSR